MEKRKALSIIDEIKRNYNLIAKDWDVSRVIPGRDKVAAIRKLKSGSLFLDVGCGNGLMVGEVIKHKSKYVGLDISEKLVAIARKKYAGEIKRKQARFVVGDAIKMPFKKNQFDFVFSFAVIHHIPSAELRQKFLDEIFRVLKPGGKVIISTWNFMEKWARNKFDIVRQLKKTRPGYDKGDVIIPWKGTKGKTVNRYLHYFTSKQIEELAKAAGFKKYKTEYFNRAGKKAKNAEGLVLTAVK